MLLIIDASNVSLTEKVIDFCYKVKDGLSGLRQFSATESSLKMMKNAFYFTLKALFVLKNFILTFWSNGLIRMIRLISKFLTSQPG